MEDNIISEEKYWSLYFSNQNTKVKVNDQIVLDHMDLFFKYDLNNYKQLVKYIFDLEPIHLYLFIDIFENN